MRISIVVLALVLSVAARAQTSEKLRAMRKETTVRIHEVGVRFEMRCGGNPALRWLGAVIDWQIVGRRSISKVP